MLFSDAQRDAVVEALDDTSGLNDLVERVARRTALPRGKALELAQMVCRLLVEELDEVTLAHLRQWLPGDVLALLEPPERVPEASLPRHRPVRRGQTLATGRPGSLHPLSEASPHHRESVVGSDEPHADTKLSSSRGTSSERYHETLSTGRSGSTRPISESED